MIIVLYYHELRVHDTNFSANTKNSAKKYNYKANTTIKRNFKIYSNKIHVDIEKNYRIMKIRGNKLTQKGKKVYLNSNI